MSVQKATLRLFKALPILTTKEESNKNFPLAYLQEVHARTIKRGYVFDREVIREYSDYNKLMDLVEELYGMTAESMNATFHKSWQVIVDTPQEELFVQAVAHYLTTYGKEAPLEYIDEKEGMFGIDKVGEKVITLPDFDANKMFDDDYVYIPDEVLDIPDLKGGVKLVIIKGLTRTELKTKLLDLLRSGIALGEDSVKDAIDIAELVELKAHEAVTIKNKEVKIAVYDYLQLVPEDPVEFLRYIVYKATGQTLLIKNKGLIEQIKESSSKVPPLTLVLLDRYSKAHGIKRLAEIFYRFKPIFLAFKAEPQMKPVINKIRRLAKKHHKPMTPDFLNNVTANLKKHGIHGVEFRDLELALKQVNTFRKIRLAYALNYRTQDVDSILYRIRNGKSYAKEFSLSPHIQEDAEMVLDTVMESIIEDIKKNVDGKRIYIPDYINYTLPATEKMFTGNFPTGTSVSVDKDIIFGINWHNVPGHRVDLDLSLVDKSGQKIGWDTSYMSEDSNVLFSGDITDARGKDGATELFYISEPASRSGLMYVNYYNHNEKYPVPFKIVVAQSKTRKEWKKNYVIDPNEMVALSNSKIEQKQKVLGLVVSKEGTNRFYFTEAYMGNSITSRAGNYGDQARKYLLNFYENAISLKDVLLKAGAYILSEKFEDTDIDLSPEALEKDTIIRLLTNG